MEISEKGSGKRATVGRHRTENEVLRVLWASPGEFLVRSQIHKRLPHTNRPTPGRVGQILAALFKQKLLMREDRRAQGARKAGFYALSEHGRELCRALGFESEEHLLFPVTEEMLRTYLTPERLSQRQAEPGRIVAVYGWRGRLGRTTLVAHVSKGLAETLEDREPLLVVDLDLEAPGLDDFFLSRSKCRGFGGLLVDLERRPPRKRTLWLRGAVVSPEYVSQPLPEIPNLFYMPSGISPGSGSLSPSERVEAMSVLRASAGLPADAQVRQRAKSSLSELRSALSDRFAKTLIDSESGRTVGACVATQILPDELILCLQETDTSQSTLNGLRAVLASFIARRDQQGARRRGTFLFRITDHTTQADLDHWIEAHIVADEDGMKVPGSYRALQLPYDVRLATRRRRWENTHFYKHVISSLAPGCNPMQGPPPPELQALQVVLDPRENKDNRSIAAGLLENAPLHELARWVDWYAREGVLPKETDSRGQKMIENIVSLHARRLRSFILMR